MSRSRRYSTGVLALGMVLGSLAFAPTAAAGAATDDSVTVNTNTTPAEISLFPQGSSLVGPVVVEIETVIVDAGDISVILDTVSLLSQVTAPFG
ncbi:hypothetical protein [Corynebacterium halotolerans]|uniref:hypothetical protein n=1 Tax=Corynebacterium halotolerans TaxID=225326 RepID=UPI003CF52AFE